jgi:hypothetical protein
MRVWGIVVGALLVVLGTAPARAQDAGALRREVEQLRKQLEGLTERLQRLEAQPAPAPPPVAQPPAAPAPGIGTGLSGQDLLRPRQPFALYQQRGSGQLLFDVGIAGDFVGNLTQHNVQKSGTGTFAGRENRFFPREVELALFGQIDPYARATMIIEAGDDSAVGLAEAHLTLLTLPFGLQAKLGQVRNRFNWSNEHHAHDLPWIDVPDVYRAFVGEEGLREKGVELSWVPDFLPFYLQVLGGVFNGDNETAFGRGRLTHPLATGRLHTFFELTDTLALQAGASVANGETDERLRSTLLGFDLKAKYRPDGWLHPLLTLATEGIYSIRRTERGLDFDGDGIFDAFQKQTRRSFGWYGWGELQPWRRWAVGVRYDSTQYPANPGWQWAVGPYVSFTPSEFLRFRLGYKHTDRTHRDQLDLNGNGGSARIVDELLFQATFILGAHAAHPF